ncbi:MAG TPA: pyridoxamine 5'-phosphate oxidase [Ohtaekwangia sp.]|nr:pyridoxamine 5'-phosphate oxidase [Ohtaekwangia sp.]
MQQLSEIRKEYSKASLDIKTISNNPVSQFETWFREALQSQVPEPNAMTLSTVNTDGRPSARVVLLKGVEQNKFMFFTNHQSDKGKQLQQNPACALTFFWPELERQIRIEGLASRVDAKRAEAYFQSRPRGSQIGAWSSPQSSVIENRIILEERVRQMETKFEGQSILPKPQQWGGYEVDPLLIEFWQGRPSRLHDRIRFSKIEGVWQVHRLAP